MLVGSEKILDWMVARGHEQRHAAQIIHDRSSGAETEASLPAPPLRRSVSHRLPTATHTPESTSDSKDSAFGFGAVKRLWARRPPKNFVFS